MAFWRCVSGLLLIYWSRQTIASYVSEYVPLLCTKVQKSTKDVSQNTIYIPRSENTSLDSNPWYWWPWDVQNQQNMKAQASCQCQRSSVGSKAILINTGFCRNLRWPACWTWIRNRHQHPFSGSFPTGLLAVESGQSQTLKLRLSAPDHLSARSKKAGKQGRRNIYYFEWVKYGTRPNSIMPCCIQTITTGTRTSIHMGTWHILACSRAFRRVSPWAVAQGTLRKI